ncbi:TetR/AcrR family transcriptional regulator [Aminobacter aminovorans]|jgi:AcrR family transcriptional regulator|uniref:Transcriptional regulator n=1 Tax=Aminobacter aminovorans TaxID=83263 RepID=A0AAC8YUU6_AMIAI|nr:TetR/AcrR family transcriptional regulator [Aminobacter aminovorans]AMS44902.1 Transcriptional regulator [Aminobacter aminovorans]MBB3704909.1 AcrR family transcriptional regulator [Aminobacter aminovorans]
MTGLPKRQQNRIDRERRIIKAALKVFSETGFSGANMDVVAVEAGLSKPTLYQYFPSKEALFSAVLLDERERMMDAFEHPSGEGMVRDLLNFAWDYADTVMRPDMLSLARLIIGEVQRFPEIGRAYQEVGPDRLLSAIMAYLDGQRLAARLVFDDTELAAQDLWGLILSAPRTQALYMPDRQPSRTELARYIHNGLRVFFKAYSTQPNKDIAELDRLIGAQPSRQVADDD